MAFLNKQRSRTLFCLIIITAILLFYISGYRFSEYEAAKAHFEINGTDSQLFDEIELGWGTVFLFDSEKGPRTVLSLKEYGLLWRAPVSFRSYDVDDLVRIVGWMSYSDKHGAVTVFAVQSSDPNVAYIEAGPLLHRTRKNIEADTHVIFSWPGLAGINVNQLNAVALSAEGEILYEYRYPEGNVIRHEEFRFYPTGRRIAMDELLQGQGGLTSEEKSTLENNNLISPSVTGILREKLQGSIDSMKDMGPGVGPWKVIYYHDEKIILYNYAHLVACDLSESNRGIYAVIELDDLRVGSYQGSVIAMIFPSPDAMACIVGTGYWEADIESAYGLYVCNFYDSSIRELEASFNIANGEVAWYRNLESSALLPWYVSVEGNDTAIIWDVAQGKKLDLIPAGVVLETAEKKYVENIELAMEYAYSVWWEKDEDTVIGAPYRKGFTSALDLKLSDFEIIEVNLKDKTENLLFKINSK